MSGNQQAGEQRCRRTFQYPAKRITPTSNGRSNARYLVAGGCIRRVRQHLSDDDVPGGGGASRSGLYLVRECGRRAAELVDGKFQFTAITLKPTITLLANADAAKAKELIEKAEANCLISNSMKARVSLKPTIW